MSNYFIEDNPVIHEQAIVNRFLGKMTVNNAELIIISALFSSAWYAMQICSHFQQGIYDGKMKISDRIVDGGAATQNMNRVDFFIGMRQIHFESISARCLFSVITLFFHFKKKQILYFDVIKKVEEFKLPVEPSFLKDVFNIMRVRRIINKKNITEACNFLLTRYDTRMSRLPLNSSLPNWHDETTLGDSYD